jgi:hypothetical protein
MSPSTARLSEGRTSCEFEKCFIISFYMSARRLPSFVLSIS